MDAGEATRGMIMWLAAMALSRFRNCVLLGLALALSSAPSNVRGQDDKAVPDEASQRVKVTTTREEGLIAPLLRLFVGLTQVNVDATYLTGDPAVRLSADAAAGQVDLFIGSEFGQLVAAKAAGLTASVADARFIEQVPPAYRDPDGHWFGLTRRMRILVVSRERVKQVSLTYEDLAEPAWKGRICIRSGLHAYNVALVASIMAHKGAAFAAAWLQGVKANLARAPEGGDREQITGVISGVCDVAVVNTYYVAGMIAEGRGQERQAGLGPLKVVFPNSKDRGAHTSISGMALMKGAANKKNALLLMDFLISRPAQFRQSIPPAPPPFRMPFRFPPARRASRPQPPRQLD